MAQATDPRLAELEQRREANVGKQIDNASLYAGSPMHYYCHCCGAHTATLPEGWWENPPPKFCANCKDLISDGVISQPEANYDDWLKEHDHPPVPR